MKWSGWIVISLVTVGAALVTAAEPRPASPRLKKVPVSPVRFAADEPAEAPPAAAITPHAPVHYRLATWDIWGGTSNGYVYSPGACDYTPPCVDHLWDGYEQRPHRCNPIHMHGGCGGMHGCGGHGGCNTCGKESSCGCGGHGSMQKRAHGWHFGGNVWKGGCSSCGEMAPTCAAPSCGSDGVEGKGSLEPLAPAPPEAPPVPMPEAGGEAPKAEAPPAPMPEKAARGLRLRGFSWPASSLQR